MRFTAWDSPSLADDSRFLSSESEILGRVTSPRVRSRNTQPGRLLIPHGCRRRDDGWHCTRGKNEGCGCLVNGEKPQRRATRRRAMHPTIVINGSNIVAARPLQQSETTGAIEATGRIKRATLSCRRLSTCPAFVRPVAASPRGGKTRPTRSHGTDISRILHRETRGYPFPSEWTG